MIEFKTFGKSRAGSRGSLVLKAKLVTHSGKAYALNPSPRLRFGASDGFKSTPESLNPQPFKL